MAESDQKQQLKDRNTKLQTMNANLKKEVNALQGQVMQLEAEKKSYVILDSQMT
jgi:frataxin-like iron-binding protein CyaY